MTDPVGCCASEYFEESIGETGRVDQTPSEKTSEGLTDRNLHVLSLLGERPNSEVTFQGLKRKLGWHQEIVSRTLKRLERDGLLLKTSAGAYRLNSASPHLKISRFDPQREDVTPVTQLWLPKDLDTDVTASTLRNTWFGEWRWYGHQEKGAERVLTWISEDGDLWINLRIRDGAAFIDAGPASSAGRDRCLYAGYDLLGHLVRRYRLILAGTEEILRPN